MPNQKENNTENNGKKDRSKVTVGDISNSAALVIGANIRVEGGINVTTVIQEIKSSGLNLLPPDYFQIYKSSIKDSL